MRLARLAALLLLAAGCAAPRPEAPPKVPSQPPAPPPVTAAAANFELVSVDSVPNADDEGVAYTRVLVDGIEAGKTPVGPRSQEKTLQLRLPPGNRPIRLEQWVLPPVGEWTRLPDDRQLRERFVRVEEGTLVRLTLRYGTDGRPSLQLTRLPAPAP